MSNNPNNGVVHQRPFEDDNVDEGADTEILPPLKDTESETK